jgi:hypothetical protein
MRVMSADPICRLTDGSTIRRRPMTESTPATVVASFHVLSQCGALWWRVWTKIGHMTSSIPRCRELSLLGSSNLDDRSVSV